MAREISWHEDRLRSLGTKGIKTWGHSKSHSPGGVECQKMTYRGEVVVKSDVIPITIQSSIDIDFKPIVSIYSKVSFKQ